MKPILFIDFDGVLCTDRFWRSLDPAEYDGVQEVLFRGNKGMMDTWMRGGHTSEEVNQYLAEKLCIPYEKLWSVFVEDARTMNVSADVLETIMSLKSRFQTVLITVNMDSLDRFTVPALGLEKYFDLIVNSASDGRFKSENGGELFVDIAERLRAPLTTAYLIDDRDNNCEVFKQLGGVALKVDDEHSTLEHLKTLSGIREFGIRDMGLSYEERPGAYGIALQDDSVLVEIAKFGYFLPGGGIEKGETAEEALVREVYEETGYEVASYRKVGEAIEYVTLTEEDRSLKKISTFYLLELGEKGKPTHPDGYVCPVEWIPVADIQENMPLESHWWAIQEAVRMVGEDLEVSLRW